MKKIDLKRDKPISRDLLSLGAKYALHTLTENPGSVLQIKLMGNNRYYWLNSKMSDSQYPIRSSVVDELKLAGYLQGSKSIVRLVRS